jgi:kynurenine formamidase
MARLVDLTMPIHDHFRWPVQRDLRGDFARGDTFQVTWVGWAVHGFTHIDAPRHIVPDGATTSDLLLEQFVGPAAVLDLTGIAPMTAITGEVLRRAGGHLQPGDIALLKTCWETVRSPETPEFWTTAPYLTRPACEWLLAREIKAIGFDFPQDYPIRDLLRNQTAPLAEFVSHDCLLRAGIVLIEYLCNTQALTRSRVELYALPLKIPDADGAPARVVVIERE